MTLHPTADHSPATSSPAGHSPARRSPAGRSRLRTLLGTAVGAGVLAIAVPLSVTAPAFADSGSGAVFVQLNSAADGATIGALPLGENVWVSLVDRDGALVQVRADTALVAGDVVVVLAEPQDAPVAEQLFTVGPQPGA